MIAAREFLEKHYSAREVEVLWTARETLSDMHLKEVDANEWVRQVMHKLWPTEDLFIQNTHLIETKGAGLSPIRWNYAQRKFYDLIAATRKQGIPLRVILLKARQLGFSTFMQSYQYHQIYTHPNRKAMTVSYDADSTTELFRKTDILHQGFYGPRQCQKSTEECIEFSFPHNGTFNTKTAGAIDVGRSFTIHHVHASEIPVWPDPETTFLALKTAVPLLPFTTIVLEATARGAQGSFYQQWREAERGETEEGQPCFIPFFAPWFWDPDYTLPFIDSDHAARFARNSKPEDHRYRERHGLTWEQMNWRRLKIGQDLNNSEDSFRQEYPADATEAFLTTGSPVWDTEKILALEQEIAPPFFLADILLKKDAPRFELSKHGNGRLRVWDEPHDERKYVIGVDVSEGKLRDQVSSKSKRATMAAIGRAESTDYGRNRPDYSAAAVIEQESGKHVALWHGYLTPYIFAQVVSALGYYYNEAFIVPEKNGPGLTVIETMIRVVGYTNVYINKLFGRPDMQPDQIEYGWLTTGPTRNMLVARIEELLSTGTLRTRSKLLVRELRSMQFDAKGTPRAKEPDKDDVAIAFALAAQGRYENFSGRQTEDKAPRFTGPDAAFWERERTLRETQQSHDRLRSSYRPPWFVGLPGFSPDLGG